AEDGIRVRNVTGVQTCALPIYFLLADPVSALIIADKTDVRRNRVRQKEMATFDIHDRVNYAVTEAKLKVNAEKRVITLNLQLDEIGRASCRERMEIGGVARTLK